MFYMSLDYLIIGSETVFVMCYNSLSNSEEVVPICWRRDNTIFIIGFANIQTVRATQVPLEGDTTASGWRVMEFILHRLGCFRYRIIEYR